jgi:hypothetical protein
MNTASPARRFPVPAVAALRARARLLLAQRDQSAAVGALGRAVEGYAAAAGHPLGEPCARQALTGLPQQRSPLGRFLDDAPSTIMRAQEQQGRHGQGNG